MSFTAEPCIGIDVGTSSCLVAALFNGKIEVIANDQGNRTTPSYVAYTESERLVGESAKVIVFQIIFSSALNILIF